MRRAGRDVVSAYDVHSALLRMREATPDLVITDIVMPHADGWELIRSYRADSRLANVPVIVMSGLDSLADLALELGVASFLRKPLRSATVVDMVDRVLQRTRGPWARPTE